MHAFSFNINIQANHNLAKALQYWMLSMHFFKQKPDFLNLLFNSLIEEEKLYPQVFTMPYWYVKKTTENAWVLARSLVGQGQHYWGLTAS